MRVQIFLLLFLVTGTMACGSGSGSSNSTTGAQLSQNGNAIAITNFAFQPATVTVTAGSTVSWTNQDSVAHTSTSDAAGWDSGSIGTGQTFALQFNTPGTFTYHCNVHPGMKATVIVH